MSGIGQSSAPQTDQSSSWNPQFSMGRSTNIDTHSIIPNKYFSISDKRRLMPEENGVISQNMYQYNRQQTGFQSSNVMTTDKSYLSSMQSNLPNSMSTGNKAVMNYNMYQRPIGGDSSIYNMSNNLDMVTSSKQGFNSNTRPSGMSQFIDPSSSSSHQFLSPTPHRTISSGSMIPTTLFNGQQNISKNRSGSYNLDSHSSSLFNQWDTHIGNFDSSEFPSLNKTKPNNTLLSQMTAAAANSSSCHNYNLSNKSMMGAQINYQMVTKSGMPMIPGDNNSLEFSIQQEDFPALPVAQNPLTAAAESQRSSSVLLSGGNVVVNTIANSCDNSGQSHNSSIVDSNDFVNQKTTSSYLNNFPSESQFLPLPPDNQHAILPTTSNLLSLTSTNNSSQLPLSSKKIQKKISQGPNNFIANIPNDMVADAFGLIGLVKLIGINDTYENLNLLAPGVETLSLNRELDSHKEIYHSYVSPLSTSLAGRPQDMDYPVPKEYRVRHLIIERLADPLPEKLCDETLFWIFYNLLGEECQLTAARQLMNRQWRYNKRERFWLTRDPSGLEPVIHPSFERGNYIVWDYEKCKRTSRSLTVYYKDLDNAVSNNIGSSGNMSQQQQLSSSSTVLMTVKLTLPFCYNSPFFSKRPPSLLSTISSSSGTMTTAAAAMRSYKSNTAMVTVPPPAPPPPPFLQHHHNHSQQQQQSSSPLSLLTTTVTNNNNSLVSASSSITTTTTSTAAAAVVVVSLATTTTTTTTTTQ